MSSYLVKGPPNVLAVTVPVLYIDAWDIKSVGYKKKEKKKSIMKRIHIGFTIALHKRDKQILANLKYKILGYLP